MNHAFGAYDVKVVEEIAVRIYGLRADAGSAGPEIFGFQFRQKTL